MKALRRPQTTDFQKAWLIYRDIVRKNYTPEIADVGGGLPISFDLLADSYERALKKQEMSLDKLRKVSQSEAVQLLRNATSTAAPNDAWRFLTAGLDAYDVCKSDIQKQLQIKYDAWQLEQQRGPERIRIRHEFDVKECKAGFAKYSALREHQSLLQAQAEQLQKVSAADASQVGAAMPASVYTLNQSACSF
jgi:hypothetical protein